MVIYRSFYDAIKELPEKNQLEILKQIFEFGLDGIESELTGLSKTIWILIKPNLEANRTKWESGCKAKQKQKRSKIEAKPKQERSETEANVYVDVDVDENEDVNEDVNVDVNGTIKNKKGKFDFSAYGQLTDLVQRFVAYRKEIKKPYKSQDSIDTFVKNLQELSGNNILVADSIINQSIGNGWQGIFHIQNKKEASTDVPAENASYKPPHQKGVDFSNCIPKSRQ